jgi:hypothetical protein
VQIIIETPVPVVKMPAAPQKPPKRSCLTRTIDAAKMLALRCVAGVPEPETTQVTEVNPEGETLYLDRWHMLPSYRLKLTVWHRNQLRGEPGKLKRKEVELTEDYTELSTANAAALRLAKSFRGEDE